MATKPAPEYKGSFVLNVVDTPETYVLMEEHDKKMDAPEDKYIQENEFYLVPDKSQFVVYDSEPTEGSPNLVTSGGIYNTVKESRENYEKATDELAKAKVTFQITIDEAVTTISGQIDADINTVNETINEVDNRVTNLGNLTIDKIGDIKATVRKDLSNSWLPCDGRNVSDEDYPEIFSLIGPKYDKINNTNTLPSLYKINGLKYINGYWFIYGSAKRVSDSAATYEPVYAYTNSLESENWTLKFCWNSGDITSGQISDIKNINGEIVILGSIQNASGTSVNIGKIKNLGNDILEIKDTRTIFTTENTTYFNLDKIAYNGEYYAVLLKTGSTAKDHKVIMLYSNSILNSNWSHRDLLSNLVNTNKCYDFDYRDGFWSFARSGDSDNSYIYFLEGINSELSQQLVFNGYNQGPVIVNLLRENGYWTCGIRTSSSIGICYKKEINDDWNFKLLANQQSSSIPQLFSFFYDGHNWIISGEVIYPGNYEAYKQGFKYSPTLENETWSEVQIGDTTSSATFSYQNNKIVGIRSTDVLYTSGTYLPNISVEGINHYIKVSEE